MDIKANEENFRYLYDLQASGRTNMFGAAAFLQSEMGLDRNEAKQVLLYWMENYEAIATELGIEI